MESNDLHPAPPKKPSRFRAAAAKAGKKLAVRIVLLVLVAAVVVGAVLWVRAQLTSDLALPAGGLAPDSAMGYNDIDFTNAVLGETRTKSALVVLEQDVRVDTAISHALANLDLFKKTKVIHSAGTGVYTVDLSQLTEENIAVDLTSRTVTITIPRTVLSYLEIDSSKTTFEETEREGLLGFGDITMTAEQQQTVDDAIRASMMQKLKTAGMYARADATAQAQVQALLQPLVNGVSDDFLVIVQLSDDTSGQDLAPQSSATDVSGVAVSPASTTAAP